MTDDIDKRLDEVLSEYFTWREEAIHLVNQTDNYKRMKQALKAIIADVENRAMDVLKEEKQAAETNLKYHEEQTKNKRLTREWERIVFGIQLCINRLAQLTNQQTKDKE